MRSTESIKHIVWDWNGTLLDDVDVCVETLNTLLAERDMGSVTREWYRTHFGFPVKGFYEQLGFDFARESFASLSATFIRRYRQRLKHVRLQRHAAEALRALASQGVGHSVVSAMEARMLEGMLADYGVREHLQHVRGLDGHHASSKVALGVELVEWLGAHPHEILFVGDTLHDCETAEAMGCRCLLFSGGHQEATRLRPTGKPVIDSLKRFLDVPAHPRQHPIPRGGARKATNHL